MQESKRQDFVCSDCGSPLDVIVREVVVTKLMVNTGNGEVVSFKPEEVNVIEKDLDVVCSQSRIHHTGWKHGWWEIKEADGPMRVVKGDVDAGDCSHVTAHVEHLQECPDCGQRVY